MKIKWLGVVLFSCVLIAVGCQPTAGQQGLEHDGGAHRGIQGKGAVSNYRSEQPNNDNDAGRRSVFPFAFNRDLGMNRDFNLDRTPDPGTTNGFNQVPYGYMEHSADDPDVIYAGYGANMNIDRQLLADGVAQIVVGLQNVQHAAVLITDDECIIGFQGLENNNTDELREQVELSGLSLTPRWFKVYATSDIQLIRGIRNSSNFQDAQHTEDQIDQQIEQIIQQLGGPKESWDNLDVKMNINRYMNNGQQNNNKQQMGR
jgi:hypothetical protein